jgi:hypothetical protein
VAARSSCPPLMSRVSYGKPVQRCRRYRLGDMVLGGGGGEKLSGDGAAGMIAVEMCLLATCLA